MKILPVFIPHLGCPFNCVYCNQHQITKTADADFSNLAIQIESFCNYHKDIKKEIAFFGGTFTGISQKLQQQLLDLIKPFLDDKTGIRISTRPDTINDNILTFLKSNGVTTIELGIQSFSDDVLTQSKRGYNSEIAILNCNKILSYNIDLGIQLMPGLLGFSEKTLAQTISTSIKIKPNFIRIYPTIVLANTKLADLFYEKKYQPLSLKDAIDITVHITEEMNKNEIVIIKSGLHSDIEPSAIVAGPYHPTFGELVRTEIYYKKLVTNYDINKTLVISSSDISLFKGFKNQMLNKLKLENTLSEIPIIIDSQLKKNHFHFSNNQPTTIW